MSSFELLKRSPWEHTQCSYILNPGLVEKTGASLPSSLSRWVDVLVYDCGFAYSQPYTVSALWTFTATCSLVAL